MQKITVSNLKTAEFRDVNLNKMFDPDGKHKQSYEYKSCSVCNPLSGGEGKLTVSFYSLEPGKANYPYHYHTGNEEVFYIISGKGTLKTPEGDKYVSEGDVIVMPANENGAHMLVNTSDAPLIYIDIDTVSSPEVVVYPESEKIMVMARNIKMKSFKIENAVNYLAGE